MASIATPQPNADRIVGITLDEATIIARNAEVESERAAAVAALVEDNQFRPLWAVSKGHHGPWHLHLSVIDGMLAVQVRTGDGTDGGTVGLGMARLRRVIREYFAICDSYFMALRRATAAEIEKHA